MTDFNLGKALESLFTSDDTISTHRSLNEDPILGFLCSDQDQQATVDEAVKPGEGGRVKFLASSWPALCERDVTLDCGEIVRVVGIRDITLLVEPITLPVFEEKFA